jgi:sulfur-carrier protein
MHWKLFANLAETAGERQVDLETGSNGTIGDALTALFERHPGLEDEVLDQDGDLREHIRLLRNGTDPFAAADGIDTLLAEGDELALFPPVSGG